jgi:hypothetical protein
MIIFPVAEGGFERSGFCFHLTNLERFMTLFGAGLFVTYLFSQRAKR